jgi:hypothetical protein
LRPETAEALRVAIAEGWRAGEETQQRLSDVLARTAHEAHEQGLRPEELIIALKRVEEEVMGQPGALRATDVDARRRFREWMVSACVRAYFGR